ncbi:MAG: metalloregulator ArsR/SmtB family transcription factor [Spirochaetota bacterium]
MALELDKTDVFYAISHPLRRAILESLVEEPRPAMYLSSMWNVSKAGLSQHLRVLEVSGLVVHYKVGRQRFYELQEKPLYAVYQWSHQFEKFWQEKLENLGEYLQKTHSNTNQQNTEEQEN